MNQNTISALIDVALVVVVMFLGFDAVTNFQDGNINRGLAAFAAVILTYINFMMIEAIFSRERKK